MLIFVLNMLVVACGGDDTVTGLSRRPGAPSVITVVIEPESVEVALGSTVQLDAVVEDSTGNQVDRAVEWSSSDETVATVDTTGLVAATGTGNSFIVGSVAQESDTAEITVTDTASTGGTPPESPADVSVSETSRTDTTVSYAVQWTESQGADSYAWNAGSNSDRWSAGESGVTTLRADFAAPRSGADDDSFFCVKAVNGNGGSDNRCVGFTVPARSGAGDPDSVAVVTVTPSSAQISTIGGTRQFSATAENAAGDAISGVTFTWSSSDAAVAAVDAGGLVTAQGEGLAQIVASAAGLTDSAVVSVDTADTGGGGASWVFRQNEPAGYTKVAEDDYDDESGDFGNYVTRQGDYRIAFPAGEPAVKNGAPGVYRALYLQGGIGGGDYSNSRWTSVGTTGLVEVYWAYTIFIPADWINNDNLVKHAMFAWGPTIGGHLDLKSDNHRGTGPIHARIQLLNEAQSHKIQVDPDDPLSTRVTRGEWHMIEYQVISNENDGTKRVRVWVDGMLGIDKTATVNNGPHLGNYGGEMWFANTYGGGGQKFVPQDQYIDIGHTYVSGVLK